MKYRPDIDGLRGIAVLSVVIFHLFPFVFVGGFVGVDIFFVISGFLISKIIIGELSRNEFSFLDFYSRRARRILPALIALLVGCFILGWIFLLPKDFIQLGKHILGGAGFVANFIFASETGYFETQNSFKPLLHLWSLAIEEQFYLAYPLILYVTYKLRIISYGPCSYWVEHPLL